MTKQHQQRSNFAEADSGSGRKIMREQFGLVQVFQGRFSLFRLTIPYRRGTSSVNFTLKMEIVGPGIPHFET